MQQRNFMLFISSCILLFLGWMWLERKFWPPLPDAPTTEDQSEADKIKAEGTAAVQAGSAQAAAMSQTALAQAVKEDAANQTPHLVRWLVTVARAAHAGERTEARLGDDNRDSPFHLFVVIDSRGAGVRKVVLNKFAAAARDAREAAPRALELVPEEENTSQASFLLYHYDPSDSGTLRPLDTLGVVNWHQVGKVEEEKNDQGQVVRQSVAFEYVLEKEDIKITKLFSLKAGEYHIGLEVTFERLERPGRPARSDDKSQFRYQLAGAHGLPIEGKWYTSIFRNAVILRTDKDNDLYRNLEESKQIGLWGGGTPVVKEGDKIIRYAGVTLQFFASVIVVSDDQVEGIGQDFLQRAAPTLEKGVTKGIIKRLHSSRSFTLEAEGREDKDKDMVFYVTPNSDIDVPPVGTPVAIISSVDGRGHDVVRSISTNPNSINPVWENDITVRVSTDPVKLTPERKVVHRYLLYNGPVKPRLLAQMTDANAVDPALLERYNDNLGLRTLTDYQSNGIMGTIGGRIGWTWLVIKSTNLMHYVLGVIHRLVPNLGLAIILLTVLVRGMMFPISRKGAMTSIKMQELAPEMARIKEKYGDDRQAAGLATWELYGKHGISPFGTCWFMLLQLPVFMGLYFALQESITFRLASFWPTWIQNLAAPDMTWEWGRVIPFISRDADYGSWVYLGPYLNILPMVAVALMVIQQKMVTPPPTDEQQEMQQKMMKYMMVVMGFMFYKVVAGLSVYFIASSIWGFTERALLPKKKKKPDDLPPPNAGPALAAAAAVAAVPSSAVLNSLNKPAPAPGPVNVAVSPPETRGRGRKQGRNKRNRPELGKSASPPPPTAAEPPPPTGFFGRLRSWWKQKRERFMEGVRDVIEQAEKKNRTERKK